MSGGREDGQAEFLEGTADNGGNDVKGHWLTREAREREGCFWKLVYRRDTHQFLEKNANSTQFLYLYYIENV